MEREPRNNPEKNPEEIVKGNLKKMVTEMTEILETTSFGGDSGYWTEGGKKLPCSRMNAYINKKTGEIITFDGDYKTDNLTQDEISNVGGVTFRIAVDFKGPSLIVETVIHEEKEVGPKGVLILGQSAEEYNNFMINKHREKN